MFEKWFIAFYTIIIIKKIVLTKWIIICKLFKNYIKKKEIQNEKRG